MNYFHNLALMTWHALAQLVRAPSHSRREVARQHLARRWLVLVASGAFVIAVVMLVVDAGAILLMPARGTPGLHPVRVLTAFGKSDYILEALGYTLIAVLLITPALHGRKRALLIGFGVRMQFLFLAVLLPVLIGEIIKGVVGRGRPFVGGVANPFNYSHFAWTESYASFPSGHAVASFALAFAVSAIWPRLQVVMWVYAVIIGLTRLVLLAHHPSDVMAGALLGVVGAMAVRYWFAARHLVFTIGPDGRIAPLAGPSIGHLKRVAQDPLPP
ncbi:MAG: phosphatase PAP2 family protein [Bradyrhizobiaceae bacterium]|nr:MAG: phosphatase PAP2 family protein [Bradyrhizobiaceae bacterium]